MKKESLIKRLVAVFSAAVLLLGVFQCFALAADSENGISFSYKDYTFEIDGGKAIITGVNEDISGIIEIPSSIKALGSQLDVAEIGKEAFKNCCFISEVTVPQSVKAVGESAFEGCTALKRVVFLSDSVTLESGVFSGCVKLESVCLPENLPAVPERAFYGCKSLESIKLPESTASVGALAFSASALMEISLPDTLASIGEKAFSESALEEIRIPNGVKTIEKETFFSCPLKVVSLPKSLAEIKDSAFANSLLSCVVIPDSVVFIGEKAFANCRLTSVIMNTLPETVGENAFSGNGNGNSRLVFYGHDAANENAVEAYAEKNSFVFSPISCNHSAQSFAIIPKVEADCVSDGHQKGIYCFECTEYVSGGEPIRTTGHRMVTDPDIDATCSSFGIAGRKHCTVCGFEDGERRQTPKKPHTPETVIAKKATFSSNGMKNSVCSVCGSVISRTVIPMVDTVYISHSEFVYDGKRKTPSVIVKDSSGKTLKKGVDYTLTYSKGRKQTGKYSVTVALKSESHSGKKVLFFRILPASPSKLNVSLKNGALAASWSKAKGADGYRVYLFRENSFVKSIDTSKTSVSFNKLSKGAKYKVVVRSYKKLKKEKLLSTYSASKTVLTTPAVPVIKSAKSSKGAVTLEWKEQKYVSGYTVYVSKNPDSGFEKLASVSGNENTSFTAKKGLKKGKTYYFRIRAYKKAKGLRVVRSEQGKTVAVTVK